MTRSKTWMVALPALLFACCLAAPKLWGDGRGQENSAGRPGSALAFGASATASLVPVASLNVPSGTPAGQPLGPAFVPTGTDPLQSGSASLGRDSMAHIDLNGASPNQTYSAYFCRFGFGPTGCVLLGQAGGISTDSSGNGHATLAFPATAGSEDWSGLVLIARTIGTATTYEYAGAVQLSISPTAQPSFEIQGQISSITSTATTESFVISPLAEVITTDSSTMYQGTVHSFTGLMVGMQVTVKGVVLSDGTLLATDVIGH